MKLFSLDGLCLILALVAAGIPLWTCYSEKRFPTKPEYLSIIVGFVIAAITFYSAIENTRKLEFVDNRITSFSADVSVDFSWGSGFNPLLDNGNDSGQVEELFWISNDSGLIKMFSQSGYSTQRLGPTSARFTARMSPKSGEVPLGQQISVLGSSKDYSIFVILNS